MVLVSLTLRTPPMISLMLPIASYSFCAPFVCLCPFYPVICSVVICTLLEGFPLPLSSFSLRNPSRFWLRSFSCLFLLQSQMHPQVVKNSLTDPHGLNPSVQVSWSIHWKLWLPIQPSLQLFLASSYPPQSTTKCAKCHLQWGISGLLYSVFIWTLQILSTNPRAYPFLLIFTDKVLILAVLPQFLSSLVQKLYSLLYKKVYLFLTLSFSTYLLVTVVGDGI